VAGLSIEDGSGDDAAPLYDFGPAVERIKRHELRYDASGIPVVSQRAVKPGWLDNLILPGSFLNGSLPSLKPGLIASTRPAFTCPMRSRQS